MQFYAVLYLSWFYMYMYVHFDPDLWPQELF